MEARIEQAAHGDREAMAQIVADHYASVYRFCARRIGPDHGQDAAQETFFTAQRMLGRFNGDSRLSTWLLGIAHNHCRNLARKKRMEINFDQEWLSDGKSLENAVIDREALIGALKSLTQEHREVVVMHELEELTYDEISTILRVPSGTVKSRLHHAFLALRRRLLPGEEVTS